MEIVILGLLVFVGYRFFGFNTRAGAEAVRAYVYLERLKRGKSSQDANAFVDAVLSDLGSDMATMSVGMAKATYDKVHGGKVLAVIGYAYRQGLRPAMPFWYGIIAQMAPVTRAIEVYYGRLQPISSEATIQKADSKTSNDENITAMKLDENAYGEAEFQRYYQSLMQALKRRNGLSDTHDLDVQILADSYGYNLFREAFRDGVSPETLADVLIRKLSNA